MSASGSVSRSSRISQVPRLNSIRVVSLPSRIMPIVTQFPGRSGWLASSCSVNNLQSTGRPPTALEARVRRSTARPTACRARSPNCSITTCARDPNGWFPFIAIPCSPCATEHEPTTCLLQQTLCHATHDKLGLRRPPNVTKTHQALHALGCIFHACMYSLRSQRLVCGWQVHTTTTAGAEHEIAVNLAIGATGLVSSNT